TPVTAPGQPIEVTVHSAGRDRALWVGAFCRGRSMDLQPVLAKAGQPATARLSPAQETGGVYRITVFEARGAVENRTQLVPVAERLVYRKPAERLNLAVKPDHRQYVPGEHATCALSATNEKDQPVPAILMMAVVDKGVLNLADEKTHRSMPTQF